MGLFQLDPMFQPDVFLSHKIDFDIRKPPEICIRLFELITTLLSIMNVPPGLKTKHDDNSKEHIIYLGNSRMSENTPLNYLLGIYLSSLLESIFFPPVFLFTA